MKKITIISFLVFLACFAVVLVAVMDKPIYVPIALGILPVAALVIIVAFASKDNKFSEEAIVARANEAQLMMRSVSLNPVDRVFVKGRLQQMQLRMSEIAPEKLKDFQESIASIICRELEEIVSARTFHNFGAITQFLKDQGIADSSTEDGMKNILPKLQEMVMELCRPVILQVAEKEYESIRSSGSLTRVLSFLDTLERVELYRKMKLKARFSSCSIPVQVT